jgi:hypothetical protein
MIALLGGTATAVAVVAMSAAPALAGITWTVKNGGTDLGVTQSGSSTLKDTSSDDTLTCTSGAGNVTIPDGTGMSGTDLGDITAVSFGHCTGPFGISPTLTPSGTWMVNAVAYASPTTTGTISNLDVGISSFLCSGTVIGTVSASYSNTTGTLTVYPDGALLKIAPGASCLGIISSGDTLDYNATYVLQNTPYVQITSP